MTRILALSLSSRGFGFAVLEPQATLVDWGVTSARGDKNAACLEHAEEMIALYQPDLVILEDTAAVESRRSTRIRELTSQIVVLARGQKIKVKLIPRRKLMESSFPEGGGTKYELAVTLAERFPEELESRLPSKRKPWESEDSRMDIFEAVALALYVQGEFA